MAYWGCLCLTLLLCMVSQVSEGHGESVTKSPTVYNHVYNIKLEECGRCSAEKDRHVHEMQDDGPQGREGHKLRGNTVMEEHEDIEARELGGQSMVFSHHVKIAPHSCCAQSGDGMQALFMRLKALEEEVIELRRSCSTSPPCCQGSECKTTLDDQTSCPGGCKGDRKCFAGKCTCNAGFTGEDCKQEDHACPGGCGLNGKCVEGICVCDVGYSGPGCAIVAEKNQGCLGRCGIHGTCVKGKCNCEAGFSGPNCNYQASELGCHGGCGPHYRCEENTCVCRDGAPCMLPLAVLNPPIKLRVVDVSDTFVGLTWQRHNASVVGWPGVHGDDKNNGNKLLLEIMGLHGDLRKLELPIDAVTVGISHLRPSTDYSFSLQTIGPGGSQSDPAVTSIKTADSPKTLKSQHEERITLTNITVRTEFCKEHISSGETKVGRHGPQADARPSSAKAARGRLYVLDVWKNGFELAWTPGRDFGIPKHFEVTWQATEGGEIGRLLVPGMKREAKVEGLAPGTRYLVAVKGRGKESSAMKAAVTTASLIGFAWSSKDRGVVLHLTTTTTAATTTTVPGIYRAPPQPMADQAVPNQLDATFLIGLAASDITASSFVLSWFGAWEMFDSFLIHYAPENQGKDDKIKDAEGGIGLLEIPGSENSVTLSGLLEATEYEISLTGMRHGEAAHSHNLTLSTGLLPPQNFIVGDVGENNVTVHWEQTAGAVKLWHFPARKEVQLDEDESGVLLAEGVTKHTLQGLRPAETYNISAVTVRGEIKSTISSVIITTDLPTPRRLVIVSLGPRRAVLRWEVPRAAISAFVINYQAESDVLQERSLPAKEQRVVLNGLQPNTNYTLSLRTAGSQGLSRAAVLSFMTLNTKKTRFQYPRDCGQVMLNGVKASGVYTIYINGNKVAPLKVSCDMDTDGGGWLVFQRRQNGGTNFFRPWADYEVGFGDPADEFWIGLAPLHALSSQAHYELRVDLRDGGSTAYGYYARFHVGSNTTNYLLRLGPFLGNAGDSLMYHHGRVFSTPDKDNDGSLTNCAESYRGGWWYHNCHQSNLNGRYGDTSHSRGVNWYSWKGHSHSISFVEMKMRPLKLAELRNKRRRKHTQQ